MERFSGFSLSFYRSPLLQYTRTSSSLLTSVMEGRREMGGYSAKKEREIFYRERERKMLNKEKEVDRYCNEKEGERGGAVFV